MFQVVEGALRDAAKRESNKILGNAVNQIAAKNPIPTIATVGAIQGFASSGNLQGAIRGAAQGVIGAGLQQLSNQIPPQLANAAAALQGISNPAAFTANGWVDPDTVAGGYTQQFRNQQVARGTATTTYAGTPDANNPAKVRTQIIDATQGEVLTIKDSFLQGLAGGLSSIAGQGINNLLGSLPSTMQNLLSTTGLTGALGSAISGGLGKALGGLGNALGDVAGKLANGLGGALASIPGVGPVFEGFAKGVGAFAKNLDGAVKGLPTDLQVVISGAAAQVGANLIGKAFKKPNVVKDVGRQVARNIRYKEDPAAQATAIAETANAVHRKIYKSTGDKSFLNAANNANKVAKKYRNVLVKKKNLFCHTQEEYLVDREPTLRQDNGEWKTIGPNVKQSIPDDFNDPDDPPICHTRLDIDFANSLYYDRTKNFIEFDTLQECLITPNPRSPFDPRTPRNKRRNL